ncbi:MAG TPA: hypothetical protein PL107_03345 [Candidatus Marinimicrobia bacterium]|nr:hypothetical protein [Bacteroidales bacterium]HOV23285.1 hypothetical protein [Candidatus Neomarinimicrobiota bacterium]
MINFKNVRTLKAILLMIFFTALTGHLISQEKISPNFKVADKLNIKTKFEKPTDKQEFPKPYKVLDSLFVEFYNWVNSYPGINDSKHPEGYIDWTDTDMPQMMMETFAKSILLTHFYPDSITYEYFALANKPSDEQLKRYINIVKEGGEWDEVILNRPAWCLNVYILNNQIKNRMSEMWNFLLNNYYILVVEPYLMKIDIIDPSLPKIQINQANYYACNVLEDIKGNFPVALKKISISSSDIYNMTENKKYIVLLNSRDYGYFSSHYEHIMGISHEYSLRSIYNKIPVYELVDNKMNNNYDLFGLGSEVQLEFFKNYIRSFIESNIGDYYEKH